MAEKRTTLHVSPPWYIYANKIKHTYGLSELIQVNDLMEIGSCYHLVINTFNNDVALSLRQIIPTTVTFGNVTLYITIFDTTGKQVTLIDTSSFTSETIAQMFCSVLKSNPLFVGAIIADDILPAPVTAAVGNVVIVIKKEIIQFFNDDISDLCQSYNEVAAKVFKDFTISTFGDELNVNFTTYSETCEFMNNLYCTDN